MRLAASECLEREGVYEPDKDRGHSDAADAEQEGLLAAVEVPHMS